MESSDLLLESTSFSDLSIVFSKICSDIVGEDVEEDDDEWVLCSSTDSVVAVSFKVVDDGSLLSSNVVAVVVGFEVGSEMF